MTSGVYVHFTQAGGITRQEWEKFAAEHEITYAPAAAGRNVYLKGGRHGIEIVFGNGVRGRDADQIGPPEHADHVVLSTVWGGPRVRDLAEIARAFWVRFGGSMFADEQTRKLICGGDQGSA